MTAPRFHRSAFDKILAIGGVILILLQVLLIADTRMQVAVVLVGMLVNQIGVWGLAERLMPDRRANLELRSEVDAFLDLVRKLSRLGAKGDPTLLQATQSAMHESVDRIAGVAVNGSDEGSVDDKENGCRAA